jgi:hypothetical protein
MDFSFKSTKMIGAQSRESAGLVLIDLGDLLDRYKRGPYIVSCVGYLKGDYKGKNE